MFIINQKKSKGGWEKKWWIGAFWNCHWGAFKVCHWSLRALRFVIGHLFTAFASLRIFVLVIGDLSHTKNLRGWGVKRVREMPLPTSLHAAGCSLKILSVFVRGNKRFQNLSPDRPPSSAASIKVMMITGSHPESYENILSVFSVCSCFVAEPLRRVALVLRSGATPQSSILWALFSW